MTSRGYMRTKLVVLLVVAGMALSLCSAAAQAESPQWVTSAAPLGHEPPNADTELAYSIALAYWGIQTPPMCQSVDIFLAPLVIGESGERVAGRATRPEAPTPCALLIEPNAHNDTADFYAMCRIMVHEVGHLLGLSHTDDSQSVMYNPPIVYVTACGDEYHRRLMLDNLERQRERCQKLKEQQRATRYIARCERRTKAISRRLLAG